MTVVKDNIDVVHLGLSARTNRCLMSGGIVTVDMLLTTTREELMNIRDFGFKALEEVESAILSWDKDIVDYYRSGESSGYLFSVLKCHILEYIEGSSCGRTLSDIELVMPSKLANSNIAIDIVDELVNNHKLELVGDVYRVFYLKLTDYIESLQDARVKDIVVSRYSGDTFGEIGDRFSITRERVRQIVLKFLKDAPRFREDDYIEVFEKYDWTPEAFIEAYGESMTVYNYLNYSYTKGSCSFEDVLLDDSIAVDVKLRLDKLIYNDHILVDGIRLKKDRFVILKYLLNKHCMVEVGVDYIEDLYYSFLDKHGLNMDDFSYHKRYFEVTLAESDMVLWKQGKRLRSYDFSSITSTEIVETLNLDQHVDVEYSTLKFYNDYPDAMLKWDIRDEYELHNLIKKVVDCEKYNIKAARMPTIEFGDADRDMQVLELLIDNAPIGNQELAQKYEDIYGIKVKSILANYFKCIDEFQHNGEFRIDSVDLPDDEFMFMSEVLSKDIYHIQEVEDIYVERFPSGNLDLISPYNIKKLGFNIHSDVLLKNHISSLHQHMINIIQADDIHHTDSLDDFIVTNPAYPSAILTLRSALDIVEVSSGQYVNIRHLEDNGVTKQDLQEYIDSVYNYMNDDFFTIKYLEIKRFTHKLNDLDLGDCFYESLIMSDSRFRYRKISGSVLFKKGPESMKLSDLILILVRKYRMIDVEVLFDIAYDYYGIMLAQYNITKATRDYGLYYSPITNMVYSNYHDYDLLLEA